jgi:hypothetical protein
VIPTSLTLPSGTKVTLTVTEGAHVPPNPQALFADAIALFDGPVKLSTGDVRDLALADFHVLRAIAMKFGLLDETELEVDCVNCGKIVHAYPCRGLEIGPWVDGELGDPELDRIGPYDVPVQTGTLTVSFERRTVRQALPLFAKLTKPSLDVDVELVEAMGVTVKDVKDPSKIASMLRNCDDVTFEAVTDAWLDARYVPRLACEAFCAECKARNTIDAPYVREFERGIYREARISSENLDRVPFPALADFVELAHAYADPILATTPEAPALVVDDGVPAVDDGGVPLLGSYVPPPPKDAPVPMGPGTVTLYYRTFASCATDDAAFDWQAELHETIEHEIEHHVYYLRGDDPMDEEERAAIHDEALRVVGASEATRRELKGFGASFPDFVRRAWPLFLLGALALIATILESQCEHGSR